MNSKINIILGNRENDQNFIDLLNEYQKIVDSCVGPINSSLKFVSRSSDYNDLILTSSSQNLFTVLYDLKSQNENLKEKWQSDLIKTIIKSSHLDQYYDSGLFLTHLVNEFLIQNSTYDDQLNRNLVDTIFKNLTEHLVNEDSPIRLKLDLNNIHFLKNLISTCLRSKCVIDKQDNEFVNLCLKAFIASFQAEHENKFAQIVYLFNDSYSFQLSDSCLLTGVLFPIDNSQIYNQFLSSDQSGKKFKCVLFDSSFSGDFDQMNNQELQIEINSSELTSNKTSCLMLDKFIQMCDYLISKFQINLILCQKVLHPSLKNHLIKKNVVYVDRLSLMYMKSISDLTGCKIVSNSYDLFQFDESQFGSLTSVKLKKILNKDYIHFENNARLVQTLVVCVQNEHLTAEFDVLLKVTQAAFQRTFQSGYAVCGGACFYSYCVCFIWKQLAASFNKAKLYELMKIIKLVFYKYSRNLLENKNEFRLDLTNGHQFELTSDKCQCGLYEKSEKQILIDLNEEISFSSINFSELLSGSSIKRNESNAKLIDSFESKVNAFKLAREILSAILQIGVYIY